MNERRHTNDMRQRQGQGFDGGRDMGRGQDRRGSQWRDQGDADFGARGEDWDRESRSDRNEREQWGGSERERYGDYGQNRRGSESESMRGSRSGGYGTSNEGFGHNRGWSGQGNGGYQSYGGDRGNWGSGGSQGWSGESSGYQGGFDRGGEGYRGSQGWSGNQGYGGGQGMGRREESRYSGIGPKGYRRSDERIREDISDRLTEDGSIDASGIEVEVQGGDITLSGTVPDREQKRRAEDIAESCSGVGNVINNLRAEDKMRNRGTSGQSSQGQSASGRESQSGTASSKKQ